VHSTRWWPHLYSLARYVIWINCHNDCWPIVAVRQLETVQCYQLPTSILMNSVTPLLYLLCHTLISLSAPTLMCTTDGYLHLLDLVEHGCCWENLNGYVLVSATSLTFLIYTDLPTCMFPFVSDFLFDSSPLLWPRVTHFLCYVSILFGHVYFTLLIRLRVHS